MAAAGVQARRASPYHPGLTSIVVEQLRPMADLTAHQPISICDYGMLMVGLLRSTPNICMATKNPKRRIAATCPAVKHRAMEPDGPQRSNR